jgi:hypothetical protein
MERKTRLAASGETGQGHSPILQGNTGRMGQQTPSPEHLLDKAVVDE